MTRSEAVRLVAQIAQCEIALVRRDAVAGPLLSQAARAAEGREPSELLVTAAGLARTHDVGASDAASRARHKVIQALTRMAAQQAQSAVLDESADLNQIG